MTEKPIATGRTAEIFAWEPGKIVKVYRPGFPADDARYEADIAVKVQESGVACPHFFGQVEVDGRPGLVYERIEGLTMAEKVIKQPWRIPAFARQMAHLHLEMHKPVISASLPSQRGKYAWRIEHNDLLPAYLRQSLFEQLALLPNDQRLCHGDFHPGNIMLDGKRSLTIDWMDVSAGHPLGDVARTSVLLMGIVATTKNPFFKWIARWFHRIYLREYFAPLSLRTSRPAAGLSPHFPRNSAENGGSEGGRDIYRAFIPIVAAVRLTEGITELQDWLLALASRPVVRN